MISGTYHGYQITGLYFCHAFSAGNDTSYTRIPHRHRFCQLVKGTLNSGHNPIGRKLFQHFLYLIRTFQCLLDQILAAERSKASLCTGTDYRVQSLHQSHIFFYRRHGLVNELHASVFYIQK